MHYELLYPRPLFSTTVLFGTSPSTNAFPLPPLSVEEGEKSWQLRFKCYVYSITILRIYGIYHAGELLSVCPLNSILLTSIHPASSLYPFDCPAYTVLQFGFKPVSKRPPQAVVIWFRSRGGHDGVAAHLIGLCRCTSNCGWIEIFHEHIHTDEGPGMRIWAGEIYGALWWLMGVWLSL